jgi:fermentation-respiration switch protein FrsA (DUF1100 family)
MTSLVLIPLFVYLGLIVFAYLFADRIIFQPPPASYRDSEKIIKLTTSGGEKISAFFEDNPKADYTILFSHGNAEDIGLLDSFVRELADSNFAVLVYDYRGYGTSDGTPSEENAYRDIDAAYEYLVSERKIKPARIILHGRSLGGAPAIDLAARRKVAGLIVESSFVSAFRVVTKVPLTPFDKFQNISKIKQVECPVLFIHGRKDEVISFRHGEQLYAAANEPKFFFALETAAHNNVRQIGGQAYEQRIRDFADNLPK